MQLERPRSAVSDGRGAGGRKRGAPEALSGSASAHDVRVAAFVPNVLAESELDAIVTDVTVRPGETEHVRLPGRVPTSPGR